MHSEVPMHPLFEDAKLPVGIQVKGALGTRFT